MEEGRKEVREGEKNERLKEKRKKERRGLTFPQLARPSGTQSGSLGWQIRDLPSCFFVLSL